MKIKRMCATICRSRSIVIYNSDTLKQIHYQMDLISCIPHVAFQSHRPDPSTHAMKTVQSQLPFLHLSWRNMEHSIIYRIKIYEYAKKKKWLSMTNRKKGSLATDWKEQNYLPPSFLKIKGVASKKLKRNGEYITFFHVLLFLFSLIISCKRYLLNSLFSPFLAMLDFLICQETSLWCILDGPAIMCLRLLLQCGAFCWT